MKLAIVGGRNISVKLALTFIDLIIKENNLQPTVIISGGAKFKYDKTKSVDYAAEVYADQNHIKKDIYDAKWDDFTVENCVIRVNRFGKEYNILAGFNRNEIIAEECDLAILIWDGKSDGSKDVKKRLENHKKYIFEIVI